MTKAERTQQFQKAFTLYRRRGYDFAYRWTLYFNLKFPCKKSFRSLKKEGTVRIMIKKDINNEK